MCDSCEEKQTMAERKPEEENANQDVETVGSMIMMGTMKLRTACSSLVKWLIPRVMLFMSEVAPVISNLFNEGLRAFNALSRQKRRNRDRNQRRRNKNNQLAPVRDLFRICSQSNGQNLHPRGSRLHVEK